MAIIIQHDPSLVLLSLAIAFLGSYVTVALCEELRTAYLHGENSHLSIRAKWIFFMGIALGGVSMWGMHFIGLASLTLRDSESDKNFQIGFSLWKSLVSLVIAILSIIVAVYVSSYDHLFAKSKGEILEMFITSNQKLSMAEVKRIKNSRIIYLISTKELNYLIIGGTIAASGFCAMHYLGMNSIEFGGDVTITWNIGMVFASCIFALLGSMTAFWIMFRFLSIFPSFEILRLASSVIFAGGLGLCHYVGMMAAEFHCDIEENKSRLSDNHINLHNPNPFILSTMIVLWLLVIIIFADLRRLLMKYRNFIQYHHSKERGIDSRVVLSGQGQGQMKLPTYSELSGILPFPTSHSRGTNSRGSRGSVGSMGSFNKFLANEHHNHSNQKFHSFAIPDTHSDNSSNLSTARSDPYHKPSMSLGQGSSTLLFHESHYSTIEEEGNLPDSEKSKKISEKPKSLHIQMIVRDSITTIENSTLSENELIV